MRSFFLSFAIIMITTAPAIGQSKDIYEDYKSKFPDEPAIYLERSEVMNIVVVGDSLRVYSDNHEDLLLLKGQTDTFSGKRVYGSHFNKIDNLKAKTLVWDKNRYKEMSVSDFKKNSDRSDGVFYDDSYYYSFNFPSVTSRNRTQLDYRENLMDIRFMSGYIFSSYLPQGRTSFTIRTTADVDLFYQVMNDDAKRIQFKKTAKGNNVTYEWSATDLPVTRYEEDGPSYRYYQPHIICYVKSFQTKKGRKTVLNGLDDLYKWYHSFVDNVNKDTSPELREIVKKMQASSKSEDELVKNIYYWVQENIRYIAFEEGMRGFIPHGGSYVCEKRYGDCKDMANLIVNMLQLANIKAYHTWIGTRDIPYKYSEVPTPLADNHMIATYVTPEGKYIFLDGTSDHTPYGLPSSMIQGKEALIGLDSNHYVIQTVPSIAKEQNIMTDTMHIRMENNQLIGSGKISLSGYLKVFGGYDLDRSDADDIKKSVAKIAGKGSNKFFLDSHQIRNLHDRDKPTEIAYSFRIGDYFQKAGDEMYLNLNLSKDHYNDVINLESRKTAREKDYCYEKYEVIEFPIPEGYTIEYLPENVRYTGELIGCEIQYKLIENTVFYRKKFYVNYLLLKTGQFKDWNDAVKKVSEIYKETLILKKK